MTATRHLCICAFWAEGEPDDITMAMAQAIAGVPDRVPHSGAAVTINEGNVDYRLRAWLRAVNIEEAADAVLGADADAAA